MSATAAGPGPLGPGELARRLGPYVTDARLARMRAVLAQRTAHLTVVLDRLYDPNNVAACLRTLDAVGLQDVHVVPCPRDPPRGPTPGARAVALDAERWLTIHRHADPAAALAAVRALGYRVGVTAPAPDGAAAGTLEAAPIVHPTALVFGAERDGVDPVFAAAADFHVALPMRGFAQSLSVSVALGIVMTRLRERLDAEVPAAQRALPEARQVALLDRWVHGDVVHADRILAELARRG